MDELEDTGEIEEKKPLIVECPHCHVKVLPKADNICPACQNNMSDLQDVDPNQVSLVIHESEELPSFCYSCNRYTERIIRLSADEESGLETAIFGRPLPENTTNIIIYLPECEDCAELNIAPVTTGADYDHQAITLVVHKGFRDHVLQLRDAQK
jgi:hypothetical protein